jgi:hypothetical protein
MEINMFLKLIPLLLCLVPALSFAQNQDSTSLGAIANIVVATTAPNNISTSAPVTTIPIQMKSVNGMPLYQCPVNYNAAGGAWGSYGCTGQITTSSTCSNIIGNVGVWTYACTQL